VGAAPTATCLVGLGRSPTLTEPAAGLPDVDHVGVSTGVAGGVAELDRLHGVCDEVRYYVVEHLGRRAGVRTVGDTGFLKKGHALGREQRQYSGAHVHEHRGRG
jgi:hypothetical protein